MKPFGRRKTSKLPQEIVKQFFEQSTTRYAPTFHWKQELREYLESNGIIRNNQYAGTTFSGVLPDVFIHGLKKVVENRDYGKRVIDDSLAVKMRPSKSGRGIEPSHEEDRVRWALFHHGVMQGSRVNAAEIAKKLGVTPNTLSRPMSQLPREEIAGIIAAGEMYRRSKELEAQKTQAAAAPTALKPTKK